MKKKTRDAFANGFLLMVFTGILTWVGTTLLEADKTPDKIEALQEKTNENRDSIQGLIDLHLQK